MKFNKIVLGYYAILFLGFGLFGFLNPILVSELVHLEFSQAMGRLDFVAMYGGLFFGLGVYFLYCLKNDVKSGLVAVLCTMGFMLVARLYECILLGAADIVQLIYLAGELFTVLLIASMFFFETKQNKTK